MSDDFNRSLKEFSEKHGAVLLGMHKDLQEMQASIEASRKELADTKALRSKVERDFKQKNAEISATLDRNRNSIDSQLEVLFARQAEAQKLYEKSLDLLTQHKQREEKYHRNMERLAKTLLLVGVAIVIACGVLIWMQ
jgi:uncharacterized protein (DUF3084 family)